MYPFRNFHLETAVMLSAQQQIASRASWRHQCNNRTFALCAKLTMSDLLVDLPVLLHAFTTDQLSVCKFKSACGLTFVFMYIRWHEVGVCSMCLGKSKTKFTYRVKWQKYVARVCVHKKVSAKVYKTPTKQQPNGAKMFRNFTCSLTFRPTSDHLKGPKCVAQCSN